LAMNMARFRRLGVLSCGLLVGGSVACQQAKPAPAEPPGPSAADKEIAALKADVQILKDKAPSASVAMADVCFHISNLWFAGQAQDWPLATYYFNEGRNHIRWLIRIN